jgi:hypothetical protein
VVTSVILAHQGGWDEALLIAAPIAVIALLLTIAKRRVDAAAANRDEARSPAEHGDD